MSDYDAAFAAAFGGDKKEDPYDAVMRQSLPKQKEDATANPVAPPTQIVQVAPVTRTEKVIKGIKDPIDGGAQLLTHVLPPSVVDAGNQLNNWIADKTGLVAKLPERNTASLITGQKTGIDGLIQQQENDYQAKRAAAGESGFDGYRTIGNIASPANLALAVKAPMAAATMGRVGYGLLNGGISGLINPVIGDDYVSEKAKQVGIGTVFGGLVPAVVGGLSRIISPAASKNADLALLKAEGVKPTIGQTLGGGFNKAEEAAQSIPILGDAIAAARSRARDQFNNAAINRAADKIGANVEGSGTAAIKEVGDQISNAYTKAKSAMGNFAIDQQAASELQALKQAAAQLPGRERFQFDAAFNTLKNQLTPQGHLLADGFKTIDSKLGTDAAKFSGSSDAYQKQLGDALAQMQKIITENAKRANPEAAKLMQEADAAYANLVRLEGASVAAKGTDGVFTPGQLLTAVRGADKSVRDRATARGTALMQDLATAGQNVLGNKLPNSGTADRSIVAGLATLAGGAAINPSIPIGLLGGAASYLPPIQNALRASVSSRPDVAKPIAETLKKASPYLVPAGAQVGLGLLNN